MWGYSVKLLNWWRKKMEIKKSVVCKTEGFVDMSKTVSDRSLQQLLIERAEELNLVVPKCARCTNPCGKCKMNFLKKEVEQKMTKPEPTSSIDYFKNKRKIEKFWK
mgnify:CR=1 FL=1